MKLLINALILLLFIFQGLSFGQAKPDSIRQSAWISFKNKEGESWKIRWNEETGLPRTIFNGLTKTYSGNARSAVKILFKEHRKLFGFKEGLTDLKHLRTQKNRGVRHVTLQQYYQGIPVEEAQYKVHIRKNGRVDMINGFYYPEINISITPSISSNKAIEIVKNDLTIVNPSGQSSTTQLVIFPTQEDKFRLVWKVIFFAEQPFTDWLYYVDAGSGQVVERFNRIMHVTGIGNVYPTHPGISSSATKDLYRLNGSGFLQGDYVHVQNDEASEAYSIYHDFRYGASDTHFDEANLYYHVDDFKHNYISGLGSTGPIQITAHAHSNYYPGPNNAWFSRSSGDIYFGDGTGSGFNPFSREDKIIYHEYSHAVIYDINTGIQSTDNEEEGGISEGTPDYFAGAHTGRSVIGEYAAPDYQRDMSNPDINSYSEYDSKESVEAHEGGEFFSAILWDLRYKQDIVDSHADFLVYDALYRISGEPTFLEFRDAMMAADDNAYGGNHNDLIQDTFADWGIGEHTPGPLSVSIIGPDLLEPNETGTFTAHPSEGSGTYTNYRWWWRNDAGGEFNPYVPPGDTWYELTSWEGHQTINIGKPDDFSLKCEVTDSDNTTATDIHSVYVGGLYKSSGDIAKVSQPVPETIELSGNYPNPFNPSTTIKFGLPQEAQVKLSIFSITGQKIVTLANGFYNKGYHEIQWDGKNSAGKHVSNGVYIYALKTVDRKLIKKMVFAK
ncbi:MAG: T9SS type A sorting domain-containing protein [Caldithrix sp.]|nr:T9SS type A sorting domain-containing protein [Caldithrix sp.]